ncbi:RING finger and SPRY domain-containing protein 1 [Coemansia sp. RSA 2523]|nr:RING finger and SPRY domain-containing protein 1 [Coemansia sp. RSA 2523]KAJ2144596.1 RING finger and SPRY domain-containing protein 1 [Coemansia sp. RSA 564]KAJ2223375.1 RING finger and SPRY domain-containing protein 1 [Coemansia sp. RSA 520]KAJ2407051.1 RING finger and SPRY domain-containing protein 1 [Coemansia sp. RSA 2526]
MVVSIFLANLEWKGHLANLGLRHLQSGVFDGTAMVENGGWVYFADPRGNTFAEFRQTESASELAVDLLNPSAESEKRAHKLKRVVPRPNSYFMDVKCSGCFNITVVFSNSQSVVTCPGCSTVLCQPTGGRARLTEGCSFRKKIN